MLRRVTAVLNGLGGSPYFLTFNFAHVVGQATQTQTALFNFLDTVLTPQSNLINGYINQEQEIFDPVDGKISGTETAATYQAVIGSASGEIIPTSNQVLFRLRTGVYQGGRQIQGRFFLPGTLESNCTNGKPATGLLNTCLSAANTLRTATSSSGPWSVWSRVAGEQTVISSINMAPDFAILRSRRD